MAASPTSSPLNRDPLIALEKRVRSAGSGPLITWYDLDQGFRSELSGKTFANWVDKSANLLLSLDIEQQPRVANTLLMTAPGHWVGLVWTMAIWQAGGCVLACEREHLTEPERLDAAVVGPAETYPIPGVETIACSLHPLGAGFSDHLDGVTDYAEVLGQSDEHWRASADDLICFDADIPRTWEDLASIDACPDRVLITPDSDPWTMISQAFIAPILGGGSSVIAVGGTAEQRVRVAAQERAIAR